MADSALENFPTVSSAGPAPGVPAYFELTPGRVLWIPLALSGVSNSDDAVWFNAANNYLQAKYGGGTIEAMPGTYNIKSQMNVGFTTTLLGAQGATILNHNFNGTAISMHRATGYGTQFGQPAQQRGAVIRGIRVDGTNAGANAIGVDFGDGWGLDIDINVVNYAGAAQIALYLINRVFWSEKQRVFAHLQNNQNPVIFDANNTSGPGGFSDVSHEYCELDFYIFVNAGQNGVQILNGCNLAGVSLKIHGNMATSNTPLSTAALSISGSQAGSPSTNFSRLYVSTLEMKVEANQGLTFAPAAIILGGVNNAIQQCSGIIAHSLANSNLNGGEFTFSGMIPNGDNGLQIATPAVGLSNTNVQNLGGDTTVWVTGANITNVKIGGTPTGMSTGASPSTFPVPLYAGQEINLVYTGATPTWVWIPRTTQF